MKGPSHPGCRQLRGPGAGGPGRALGPDDTPECLPPAESGNTHLAGPSVPRAPHPDPRPPTGVWPASGLPGGPPRAGAQGWLSAVTLIQLSTILQTSSNKGPAGKQVRNLSKHLLREDVMAGSRLHQGDAGRNHGDRAPRTCHRGSAQEDKTHKCWRGHGESEPCGHHAAEVQGPQVSAPVRSRNSAPGCLPREHENANSRRYPHPHIHCSLTGNSQHGRAEGVCPPSRVPRRSVPDAVSAGKENKIPSSATTGCSRAPR